MRTRHHLQLRRIPHRRGARGIDLRYTRRRAFGRSWSSRASALLGRSRRSRTGIGTLLPRVLTRRRHSRVTGLSHRPGRRLTALWARRPVW